MKVKNMLEFIKLPEGSEFDIETLDLTELEGEWNRQYNGMKVSVTKEVTQTVTDEVTQGLLTEFGFENKEAIKTMVDSTKDNEVLKDEKYDELKTQFDTLTTTLQEKDAKLLDTGRLSYLSSYKDEKGGKLNPERIAKAHKLILSEVSEEKDYETSAKEFIVSTPEWLVGAKKPGVNLGGDENLGNDETVNTDAKAIEDAW